MDDRDLDPCVRIDFQRPRSNPLITALIVVFFALLAMGACLIGFVAGAAHS